MVYKYIIDFTLPHRQYLAGQITITDLLDNLLRELHRLGFSRPNNYDTLQKLIFACNYVRENHQDLTHYEILLDSLHDLGEKEDQENIKNVKLFYGEIDGRW